MWLSMLLDIVFKGGATWPRTGYNGILFLTICIRVSLFFFVAICSLSAVPRLNALNVAAVARQYGSIPIVTFAATVSLLNMTGITSNRYLVAAAAAMEAPANFSASGIAHRFAGYSKTGAVPPLELLANGSIVLLVGALVIGTLAQDKKM